MTLIYAHGVAIHIFPAPDTPPWSWNGHYRIQSSWDRVIFATLEREEWFTMLIQSLMRPPHKCVWRYDTETGRDRCIWCGRTRSHHHKWEEHIAMRDLVPDSRLLLCRACGLWRRESLDGQRVLTSDGLRLLVREYIADKVRAASKDTIMVTVGLVGRYVQRKTGFRCNRREHTLISDELERLGGSLYTVGGRGKIAGRVYLLPCHRDSDEVIECTT